MRTQHAFTLVELLIVLALVAITGNIAIPALQDFLERNQQQMLYQQISRALQHARSYAVTHRVPVELCASNDGLSCNSDWSHGWLLRELNQTSTIAVTLLNSDRQRLQWKGFNQTIQFHGTGTSPIGNGRFYSCHKGKVSWQLVINRQGRLRTEPDSENITEAALCSG